MDGDQLILFPRKPPRYDEQHPAVPELKFIMAELHRLRRDLRSAAMWTALALGVLGIVVIETFWRVSLCHN